MAGDIRFKNFESQLKEILAVEVRKFHDQLDSKISARVKSALPPFRSELQSKAEVMSALFAQRVSKQLTFQKGGEQFQGDRPESPTRGTPMVAGDGRLFDGEEKCGTDAPILPRPHGGDNPILQKDPNGFKSFPDSVDKDGSTPLLMWGLQKDDVSSRVSKEEGVAPNWRDVVNRNSGGVELTDIARETHQQPFKSKSTPIRVEFQAPNLQFPTPRLYVPAGEPRTGQGGPDLESRSEFYAEEQLRGSLYRGGKTSQERVIRDFPSTSKIVAETVLLAPVMAVTGGYGLAFFPTIGEGNNFLEPPVNCEMYGNGRTVSLRDNLMMHATMENYTEMCKYDKGFDTGISLKSFGKYEPMIPDSVRPMSRVLLNLLNNVNGDCCYSPMAAKNCRILNDEYITKDSGKWFSTIRSFDPGILVIFPGTFKNVLGLDLMGTGESCSGNVILGYSIQTKLFPNHLHRCFSGVLQWGGEECLENGTAVLFKSYKIDVCRKCYDPGISVSFIGVLEVVKLENRAESYHFSGNFVAVFGSLIRREWYSIVSQASSFNTVKVGISDSGVMIKPQILFWMILSDQNLAFITRLIVLLRNIGLEWNVFVCRIFKMCYGCSERMVDWDEILVDDVYGGELSTVYVQSASLNTEQHAICSLQYFMFCFQDLRTSLVLRGGEPDRKPPWKTIVGSIEMIRISKSAGEVYNGGLNNSVTILNGLLFERDLVLLHGHLLDVHESNGASVLSLLMHECFGLGVDATFNQRSCRKVAGRLLENVLHLCERCESLRTGFLLSDERDVIIWGQVALSSFGAEEIEQHENIIALWKNSESGAQGDGYIFCRAAKILHSLEVEAALDDGGYKVQEQRKFWWEKRLIKGSNVHVQLQFWILSRGNYAALSRNQLKKVKLQHRRHDSASKALIVVACSRSLEAHSKERDQNVVTAQNIRNKASFWWLKLFFAHGVSTLDGSTGEEDSATLLGLVQSIPSLLSDCEKEAQTDDQSVLDENTQTKSQNCVIEDNEISIICKGLGNVESSTCSCHEEIILPENPAVMKNCGKTKAMKSTDIIVHYEMVLCLVGIEDVVRVCVLDQNTKVCFAIISEKVGGQSFSRKMTKEASLSDKEMLTKYNDSTAAKPTHLSNTELSKADILAPERVLCRKLMNKENV